MTSMFSWPDSVSRFPASFCTRRPNLPVTPGISWLPTFVSQSSVMKRTSLLVLVLQGFVSLHRTGQLQLLGLSDWGIDLDYCDIEWFALEINWNHSVVFEIVPNYCILDFFFFIDYEGYSISAGGFLPTVVDTIIIWIKFAHSCPLSLVLWFLRCRCSLLLSPVWPCPVYLVSIPGSCAILFFTALDLYFYHQTHPQLSIVSTLAQPLHSF